jgi:hypothetical protein
MMKPIACFLGLLIFTGCGSNAEVSNQPAQLSPDQMRNNFDYCVLAFLKMADEKYKMNLSVSDLWQQKAKTYCAPYLVGSEPLP